MKEAFGEIADRLPVGQINQATDLNQLTTPGVWRINGAVTNGPAGVNLQCAQIIVVRSSDTIFQIAGAHFNIMYTRGGYKIGTASPQWGTWAEQYSSVNPQKNISGNAATATNAVNATNATNAATATTAQKHQILSDPNANVDYDNAKLSALTGRQNGIWQEVFMNESTYGLPVGWWHILTNQGAYGDCTKSLARRLAPVTINFPPL